MSKSSCLRSSDVRALFRLINECRELGDDRLAWREHLIEGLARLVDAEQGHVGEMAGCRSLELRDLGLVRWWQAGSRLPPALDDASAALVRDPNNWPATVEYHRRSLAEDGLCLARSDFIAERAWHALPDYRLIRQWLGIDHRLWCFQSIGDADSDERSGIILARVHGRRDFSGRDRTIVREALAASAPLVGGALARFADPSPMDLADRAREVLACLLEGDADKQVAVRLGLSQYTVNQYTKAIYRHFGVRSRAELLARWVRRGWGRRGDHRDGPSDGPSRR
jgi:DNA-binding CsgD family transcriptional regulator